MKRSLPDSYDEDLLREEEDIERWDGIENGPEF